MFAHGIIHISHTRTVGDKARLLYVIALQSYRTARYFHKPTLPPTVYGTRVVKVWVPVPYRNLHFRFVLQVGREELEMDL